MRRFLAPPRRTTSVIQVFGAGSLGTLVGALLSRAGADVHLVGRERVVKGFEDGVRVEGHEDFTARPSLSTEPRPAEVTLVAVKSYDTDEAASELAQVLDSDSTVVSLQNGMGNEETLNDALGATVLGGTATYGANLNSEEGYVEYTGEGDVLVGDHRGGPSDEAESVAGALVGLNVSATEEMDIALWEKLAVNCAINPVTGLTRLTNGEAAESAEGVMRSAAVEVKEVARENGVKVENIGDSAIEVAHATAENESSTLQDVRAGRRTEIGSLNGYVVGKVEETDVPTNRMLVQLVRATERRTK